MQGCGSALIYADSDTDPAFFLIADPGFVELKLKKNLKLEI